MGIPPYTEPEDLWASLRKGDEKAFSDVFRLYYPDLFNYAGRIIRDEEQAKDVVQEVFIALLDVDLSQIRHRESYLYRCVRNAALDRLHRRMKTRVFDLNSQEIVRLADESPIM